MNSASQWALRKAGPDDIPFIYSTWLNSYRTGSGLGLSSGKRPYYLTYNCILDQILARAETWVAVSLEDASVIYAYLVHEANTLHYVYVKEGFRGFGIARALFESAGLPPDARITHRTKMAEPILRAHPALTFNITRLLAPEETHGQD